MTAALLLIGLLLPPAGAQVTPLKPFVRGSWTEMRQDHRGTPIIVHFWGLSCAPCLAELPHWGELLHDRPGLGLVTVAADPVPEDPARIRTTLERAGLASAENWLFADTFSERLRFEVDPDWAGELPFNVLMTTDGRTTTMVGSVDFATIRQWLDRQAQHSNPH
jgi:thiol-disulfide isomerase/thioredoxin